MAADGAALGETAAFANPNVTFEGWYWALASRALRPGQVRAVRVMGRELAIYRGDDGLARARDAFCPHMGAHLALGRVEGTGLRCFFHGWRFDAEGGCDHIPALDGGARPRVRARTHEVVEQDGLIWLWVGDRAPSAVPPAPPQLADQARVGLVAAHWRKACHPNVVLINAIDEHHFRTVHAMPGEVLKFATESVAPSQFRVTNSGAPPRTNLFWRLAAWLYRDAVLAYEINYFSGATGTVSFGPAWLRLHLMFATRMSETGGAEGVTVALSQRGKGIGRFMEPLILGLTALGGAYFARGDTKVFDTIRFALKTPIPADRTVVAYMRHVEAQPKAQAWRS